MGMQYFITKTYFPDFHSHTRGEHDYLAYLDAEATIQWHLAAGFTAFAVTDHDTVEPSLKVRELARTKYNDRVKVIVGEEWVRKQLLSNTY